MEVAAVQKKRSIGVAIVSILVMASGLAGVASLLPAQPVMDMFIRPWGAVLFCLCFLLCLGEVFLAAHVLRCREWARAGLVALMLVNIVFLLFAPFLYNQGYVSQEEASLTKDIEKMKITQEAQIQKMRARFEDRIKTFSPEEKERMRQAFEGSLKDLPQMVLRLTMLVLSFCAFLWYVAIIYFFTRPKVIAQFD